MDLGGTANIIGEGWDRIPAACTIILKFKSYSKIVATAKEVGVPLIQYKVLEYWLYSIMKGGGYFE